MIVPRESVSISTSKEELVVSLPTEQALNELCDMLHEKCHRAGLGVGLVQLNNLIAEAKFMREAFFKLQQKLKD